MNSVQCRIEKKGGGKRMGESKTKKEGDKRKTRKQRQQEQESRYPSCFRQA